MIYMVSNRGGGDMNVKVYIGCGDGDCNVKIIIETVVMVLVSTTLPPPCLEVMT